MHMRMMDECRAPRVQHGRDLDTRAETLGIVGLQPTDLYGASPVKPF